MIVPASLTIGQLQDVVQITRKLVMELAGSSGIPTFFQTFPINRIGQTSLTLITHSMPDKLADGVEGAILLSMLAAFRFLRQILDRIAQSIQMKRDEFISALLSYCMRFGPNFAEAIKLRMPVLVKQAFESSPSITDFAQRLSRLTDITLTTITTLRDIIGERDYNRWLACKDSPRGCAIVISQEENEGDNVKEVEKEREEEEEEEVEKGREEEEEEEEEEEKRDDNSKGTMQNVKANTKVVKFIKDASEDKRVAIDSPDKFTSDDDFEYEIPSGEENEKEIETNKEESF
jgi:hypothetical protein